MKQSLEINTNIKLVVWSFLIFTFFGVDAIGQIVMTNLGNGKILKQELIHEEDYLGSKSKCILWAESRSENKKWETKLLLFARLYVDETTGKETWANPNISLFEGSSEGLLSYINMCEEILILQPVFEDKHIMNNHHVYVNNSLGTTHINIYYEGKGWVNIGEKAINRIKKQFLKWAKKEGVYFDKILPDNNKSFTQSEHTSKFEYTLIEGTGKSVINDYIIVETELSALDEYNGVLLNLESIFNNTNGEITAKEEGKHIKVAGTATDLYSSKTFGKTYSYTVHYNLIIYFKDNRIIYDLVRLDWWYDAGPVDSATYFPLKTIKTHSKKGKPKSIHKGSCERVSEYFNDLVRSTLKEIELSDKI
jgi:hypothetical protein